MIRKNLFLVPFLLGLTSCYYAGKEQNYYDKFTNERISSVNLGMIKTTKNLGMVTDITGQLLSASRENQSPKYFFNFNAYVESDGRSCPHIKKGAKAIFIANETHYTLHSASTGSMHKMMPGLFLPSCSEQNIKIGPLDKKLLTSLSTAKSVEFKIEGRHSNLEGYFPTQAVNVMHSYLNKEKPQD